MGGAPRPRVLAEAPLSGKVNYMIDNNPQRWRTGIPTYAKVRYVNVYPGIDMILHGEQGDLEYDFEVKPNADPRLIKLDFRGSGGLRVDSRGNLRIQAGDCAVFLRHLRVYQRARRHVANVRARYVIRPPGRVGFQVGAYDHTQRLIIDPVLTYSTYLGGSGYDSGSAIAVDSTGAVYVTGFTMSDNFPVTAGAYDTACGTSGSCNGGYSDVFVTKLSPGGSSLVYSTYLGGSKDDLGKAIAVDSSGSAYVAGQTFSSDFPVVSGAVQGSYGGTGDAFVAKLSPSGSSLEYSTFLGGSATDEALAIAVDSLGDAYVTGRTFSTNFPTQAPIQSANDGGNDSDAFVAELNATGSALVYSTYLGGSGQDAGTAIAVDAAGDAFVTGFTKSADFPLAAPLEATCASCPGYADAFVSEITANGTSLAHSTYLGGNAEDEGTAIALDQSGNIYLTGFTYSTNFPVTSGAYQTSMASGSGAFVTTIAPNFSSILYSTFLHGGNLDFGQGIATDSGNAFITGQTYSTSFPTANSIQSSCKSSNCYYGTGFVSEMNASGSGLVFSTYLGGSYIDQGYGIALDSSANTYVAGEAGSTDFPTAHAFQGTFGGSYGDAFVSNIGLTPAAVISPSSLTFSSQSVGTTSSPQTVTLSSNGTAPVHFSSIAASGDFAQTNTCGSGSAAGSTCTISVTFTPTATGTRTGTLTITDNAGGSPQTVGLTGTGAGGPAASLSPASLTFNSQNIGTTSSAQPVSLTNTGSAALTITSIGITGTNAGDFAQTNNCGITVNAGGSCTINATFTPTATGTRSGSVTITDNASGSPQNVALTGTGASPGASLAPSSLTFSSQQVGTTSPAQAVTLTNNGNATLTVTSIGITGANAGDFAQTNNCGTTVNAGASCTINATFTPTATGTRAGSVTITDNASDSPQTVALTGTGAAAGAPAVSLSPSSLTFSSQTVGTTSAAQAVTLTNAGTATLTITSIAVTGTNAADFAQTNNCGTSVAPNANCRINVTFTPSASGTSTAGVTITDNASDSPQTVALTGTGAAAGAPAVSLSPSSLAFSSQTVGTTSAAQAVTLTNSGSETLTITSIAVSGTNAGDFAQSNTCGTSVAPNANCTINVTFTPSATGTSTAGVTITDNASDSPQTVALTGTGAAAGAPAVGLSPSSLTFNGQTVGTTSAAQAVTLTNSGSATLTITSISVTGTNAVDFAQTNNCGTSLAANAGCSISTTFAPTATGTRTASVTITDNAGDSPENVPLSGTGANSNAAACTKFVAPTGSDANSGSVGSPWLTLQKAFNSSVAGDVICLRAGTYPSQSTTTYSQIMNTSGVAGNPITVQNYPGEAATVQGNTRINGAYIILKGTAITPPYGLVFTIGAAGLAIDAIDVLNTHDVTVDHIEIEGFDSRAGYSQSNGCNNQVLGSYIHDNGSSTSSGNGISWGSTSSGCTNGGLIANNVIEHNTSIGIQLYSGGSSTTPSNVVVEENTFADQGAYGITVWGDNNVVADNVAYGNGDAVNDTQGALYKGTSNVVDHNVTFSPTSRSRSGWYLAGGCCLTNNLASDPLFVSPSTRDWHLTSTSPAIGYSNTSHVQPVDKDGVTRGPDYDAGAYQYVAH
ncbi:MAG TPA: choice-of-anchor D domain-containing protein [Terriglobia bacterium]|nr:choice-of-anchor D domain-containing protein [Terriglobia bacterium]